MNFQEIVNKIYGPTLYNNYSEFIVSVIEKERININDEHNDFVQEDDK